MKNIFNYGFLGLTLAATLPSCIDTMDTKPASSFTSEVIWGSKSTVEAFINSIYDGVITGAAYAGSGSSIVWESRTPNSVKASQVGEGIDAFTTELGISTGNDFGVNFSGSLRKCNLVIKSVEENPTLNEADKASLIAQAKFLRGMIFFNQARKIGRFVPITEVLETENPEAANIPMTKSVAESYEYVIADLKAGVEGFPTENSSGLPTRWAAQVFLSRAALQAYAYTNNASYLDIAINAANDVINNSGISLATNLAPNKSMWNETDLYNPEILWAYYRNKDNTQVSSFDELMRTYPNIGTDDFLTSLSPIALKQANGQTFEGWAIYFPTQDLVDHFLVTDEATGEALPWYETSQYVDNVDVLDPNSVTKIGQIDSYVRSNTNLRSIPSNQDLSQTKDGYANFLRYHQLKADADRDLSAPAALTMTQFWLIISTVFGVLFGGGLVISGIFVKERINPDMDAPVEKFNLKRFLESYAIPFRNKSFRWHITMYATAFMCADMISALAVYYATDVWAGKYLDLGFMELKFSSMLIVAPLMVMAVVAFPIVRTLMVKKDKQFAFRVGLPFYIIGGIMLAIMDPSWTPPIVVPIVAAIMGLGFGGAQMMPWIIFPDTVDVAEMATGERPTGTYSGIMTLIRKVAGALGVGMVGWVIDACGYQEAKEGVTEYIPQTPEALLAIKLVLGISVAVFITIAFIASFRYKVNDKKLDRARYFIDKVKEEGVDSLTEEEKAERNALIKELYGKVKEEGVEPVVEEVILEEVAAEDAE